MSRSQAQALIQRGYVRLNGLEMESQTKECKPGDVLSVRTQGKCKILEISGKSKKDKFIVLVGQYID
jgi:RNA-binding protein YlmH